MNFSEKLKKLRKENDLTQDQLAEKLFVSRTAVSKWETDKGFPGIDNLKMISELFHISIDELISDSDVENKRLLEEKQARKMYVIAIIFLIIAAAFSLCAYFLKIPMLNIGSYLSGAGYIVFGLLSKPKYKRVNAKKLIVPYVISRAVILVIVITVMIMELRQLA